MCLTGPKLGLNLRTTATAHVTLYRTWHPSDLTTGLHRQVKFKYHIFNNYITYARLQCFDTVG